MEEETRRRPEQYLFSQLMPPPDPSTARVLAPLLTNTSVTRKAQHQSAIKQTLEHTPISRQTQFKGHVQLVGRAACQIQEKNWPTVKTRDFSQGHSATTDLQTRNSSSVLNICSTMGRKCRKCSFIRKLKSYLI